MDDRIKISSLNSNIQLKSILVIYPKEYLYLHITNQPKKILDSFQTVDYLTIKNNFTLYTSRLFWYNGLYLIQKNQMRTKMRIEDDP